MLQHSGGPIHLNLSEWQHIHVHTYHLVSEGHNEFQFTRETGKLVGPVIGSVSGFWLDLVGPVIRDGKRK